MAVSSVGSKVQSPGAARGEVLRVGSTGPQVRKVQQELAQLGFLAEDKVSGTYDQATQEAVLRFRAARKELADQGAVNDKLRGSLRQMAHRWDTFEPHRHRVIGSQQAVEAEHARDAKVTEAARAQGGVGLGARGPVVAAVEAHLKAAGYNLGQPDGTFGLRTAAAVKAFQRAEGLPETGAVDGKTWAALRKARFVTTSATGPAQAQGERSQAVLATEKMLHALGYQDVKVDGFMGGLAAKAVKDFQQKHHLEATGQVNGATLQAMKVALGAPPAKVQRFIDIAKAQVGDPYVFGATGPDAFDCSGLVYYALNHAGVDVPRMAARGYQAMFAGSKVDRSQLKPGDLIFYYYPNSRGIPPGQASHIEIYLGNGLSMGTDNPSEGARVEPVDWSAFIGGARVPQLYQ